jgi:DNA polymerase-3 subunit gamma/tau
MAYIVLARKWRPQTFEDLIGQEAIAKILKNAIANNHLAHAYIFSGPRGVGKTTTARILAKALNCEKGPTPDPCGICPFCLDIAEGTSMDVLEIDGASNTGVDNIRDLRERIRYAPSVGRYKVYIIDEAHMLSTSAFNALLKTLEEPPPHVIFILATTEPRKIPPTVLSRCQHLPFRRIPRLKIKDRLKYICNYDNIRFSESALDLIARAGDGSMRDALTILDQISSFSEDITVSEIQDLLGFTSVEILSLLTEAVIKGDNKSIITMISELSDAGTDMKIIIKDLLQFVRNLLIVKIVQSIEDIIDLSEEELEAINKLKDLVSEEYLILILSELIKAEPIIKNSFYPRVTMEVTLIRLALLNRFRSIEESIKYFTSSANIEKIENSNKSDELLSHNKQTIKSLDNSLSSIWEAVMKKIDEINHPLYSKLQEGDIVINNDEIKIKFKGGLAVHAESVKENLPFIKGLIKEISGKDIPVSIKEISARSISKKDIIEDAKKNPAVKEVLKLFDGRIIDVIPNIEKNKEAKDV